jgi:aminopeptidase
MRDPRVTALAQILVRYSTGVKEGDVCTIEGESAAEPLLHAVYEEVLRAGGNPIVNMALEGQSATYFEHASDPQLDWISPIAEWAVENADVRIAVMASQNTRALSQVPPERQAKRQAATQRLMKRAMDRSAEGTYRWALTLFPTHATPRRPDVAERYEDFLRACLATDDDPSVPGRASPRRPRGLPTGSRAAPRSM